MIESVHSGDLPAGLARLSAHSCYLFFTLQTRGFICYSDEFCPLALRIVPRRVRSVAWRDIKRQKLLPLRKYTKLHRFEREAPRRKRQMAVE